ncbi:MAG: coproporphyrinogen III oxidase family protein [Clostridiales bacterium]|jgi:oxygen-independent coproporphyrinogen-3 oxidase|nr:coproporphyrinogen III oxidase family protein [Clostridiales bacterium]
MRYCERYKSHHDASRKLKRRFAAGTDKAEYLAGLLNGPADRPRVVYLHVPFCNKVCGFCPFHRPDSFSRREYDKYLIGGIRELAAYEYSRAPVNAVNFGGGTPTALSPAQMARVLAELHNSFDIPPGTEISVETSVTELTDEMLSALKEGGVNRLSVGVQTFDDASRRLLNRRGSGAAAAERIRRAISFGFVNTGIDLIYNYPDQTPELLERDIDTIKSLNLAGVSFYSLMLHEGTPLYKRLTQTEKAVMADLERERGFFFQILDGLSAAGFKVFELTKLIRDGLDRYDYMRVRHGGGSCLAVGSGAGGNIGNYVYSNSPGAENIGADIKISSRGRVVSDDYMIIDEFINELQKTAVDLSAYSRRLKLDLNALLGSALGEMADGGLVQIGRSGVRLTRDGLFFGNNIIDELVGLIINVV